MRRLSALILVVASIPLLALTCVTETRQRGPDGPWVGEVVNSSDLTLSGGLVSARIFDASGRLVGDGRTGTCPIDLAPGQRGTFELFYFTDDPAIHLPLRAEFSPVLEGYYTSFRERTSEGLSARVLTTNADGHYALVEVANDSAHTYQDPIVCGAIRGADGRVLEVGTSLVFPRIIRPLERRQTIVYFHELPSGTFALSVLGSANTNQTFMALDPANFEIAATRRVIREGRRYLEVLGELRNDAGLDLADLKLSAHAGNELLDRVDQTPFGCLGLAMRGSSATARIMIPVSTESGSAPVIEGIEATRAADGLAALQVDRVIETREPGGRVRVDATVTNQTTTGVRANTCVNLRTSGGHLAGTAGALPGAESVYLGPGDSVDIELIVDAFGTWTTAEVISIGFPSMAPVPSPH